MNEAAIGLGLLVAGAVVVFVAWPWWTRRKGLESEFGARTRPQGETLAERYEAALTALRDLDFDRTIGKVTEEDYGPLRQTLLAESAAIMTQLDDERAATEADLEALIEAEVLVARQTLGAESRGGEPANDGVCPACGRAFRPGDRYCAGCGAQLNALCSECGRAVHPDDRFCTSCGAELALTVS